MGSQRVGSVLMPLHAEPQRGGLARAVAQAGLIPNAELLLGEVPGFDQGSLAFSIESHTPHPE